MDVAAIYGCRLAPLNKAHLCPVVSQRGKRVAWAVSPGVEKPVPQFIVGIRCRFPLAYNNMQIPSTMREDFHIGRRQIPLSHRASLKAKRDTHRSLDWIYTLNTHLATITTSKLYRDP